MSIFPRLSALLRFAGLALFIAIPGAASAAMLNGVDCETINIDVTENNGSSDVSVNVLGCELGDPFPNAVCGDQICNGSETNTSCPGDCPAGPVCGNAQCESGESQSSCPQDCGSPTVCGNQVCEAGENASNCPSDCGQPPPAGCTVENTISAGVRDGWFGVENITFAQGETKRFCAVVTTDQNPRLRFEASDISNLTCARFNLKVTQVTTGKNLTSGIVSSPSLRFNAQVGRGIYNYALTAAGTYYIDVTENNGPSNCRRSDISWRNY